MEEFSWFLTFIGRPNAGKSSLISQLTTASPTIGKKPGSTRKIIHYKLAKKFTAVDVPGWGKIHSRAQSYEDRIKDEIVAFFEENYYRIPACVLVIDVNSLIDVSERLSKKNIVPIDQELYFFLKNLNMVPIVALNKIDKISPKDLEAAQEYFKKLIEYDSLPAEYQECVITVSAKRKQNLAQLRDIIRKHLRKADVEEFERYVKVR
ncbi:MAG: GTP-binding protein EngB [Asgard group archaeon]|nr:GTP-binding protein EngB [Asgard group archaeon]